ncbi:hypothetical protein EDD21DRAFT_214282 [Dissophora ornata]|nr:hypothetical protein EDD21DRAFT_214282 [Dissophora ornata]
MPFSSLSPQPVHSLDVSLPLSHSLLTSWTTSSICLASLYFLVSTSSFIAVVVLGLSTRGRGESDSSTTNQALSFEYRSAYLGFAPRVEAIRGRESGPMALMAGKSIVDALLQQRRHRLSKSNRWVCKTTMCVANTLHPMIRGLGVRVSSLFRAHCPRFASFVSTRAVDLTSHISHISPSRPKKKVHAANLNL